MQFLHLHKSCLKTDNSVQVEWQVYENTIEFNFKVINPDPNINNVKFGDDYTKNWGLWEYDVVEIFIKRQGDEYLEFQLSPLGQIFGLVIKKPREEFDIPKTLDVEFKITNESPWCSSIIIHKDDIPGIGSKIYGNCFSCLGKERREYYGLRVNPEDQADFHRPELFVCLGEFR